MAKIGHFERGTDGEFRGTIATLSVRHDDIVVRPVSVSPNAHNPPTHRVYVGKSELGAGWLKEGDKGVYIDLKLDDPSFAAPIYPRLALDENKEWVMFWDRDSRR